MRGISNAMSITGAAQTAPLRAGYPPDDTIGGMKAAFAIVAALNARERGAFSGQLDDRGRGATIGWVVSNPLRGGVAPAAHGNENTPFAPSGTLRTVDQPINIAAKKDGLRIILTDVRARPDFHPAPTS